MKYIEIIADIIKRYEPNFTQIDKILKISTGLYGKWIKRGRIGTSCSAGEFYEKVFEEFLFTMSSENINPLCTHEEFAINLMKDLELYDTFPEIWLKDINKISGTHSNFDKETFRVFVISLLDLDKSAKKPRRLQKTKIVPASNRESESVYFEQTIFDKKTKKAILKIANPDFSKLKDHRRLIVEGPGGQGKSRFLTEVQYITKKSDFFSHVFHIELTKLVSSIEKHIELTSVKNHFLEYILSEQSYDSIPVQECLTNPEHRPVLLLLDGLNELYALPNTDIVEMIRDELYNISEQWKNTYIIITCRSHDDDSKSKVSNYRGINSYKLVNLSGVPDDLYEKFLLEHKNSSKVIKKFARIPLYYNYLTKSKNIENIHTQYDLLFQIYYNLFKQNKHNVAESYFVFYIVAPLLAQKICNSSSNHMSSAQIADFISEISKMNLSALYETVLSQFGDAGKYFYSEIDVNQICKVLLQTGPLQKDENDQSNYKFYHDDIRDFLVAFLSVMSIKTLDACHASYNLNGAKDIFANLNVSVDVANLIKEELNLIGTSENYDVALNTLYAKLLNNTSYELTETKILFAHTAFLIADYLQIGYSMIETPLHEILSVISEECIISYDNEILDIVLDSYDDKIIKERCKLALADIFSKECEYYRRNKKFHTAMKHVNVAEKIVPNSNTIKNQKAKLYLAMFQQLILQTDSEELMDINVLGFSDKNDLYKLGLQLFKENSDDNFNLSTNVLGMLYSVPAPYMIKNHVGEFDFIEAFYASYNTIKRKDYYRREIDYPVRQAVSLLLKGYVKVKENFIYHPGMLINRYAIVEGDKNPLRINTSTKLLAEMILSRADGQYINSINYLRGLISLYKGQEKIAEEYFRSEDNNLVNQIVLNYRFSRNYNIATTYNNIKKSIIEDPNGIFDGCHPIYWYCDGKNLELAFNPEKLDFFNEFEKDLSDECKTIVRRLTL